LLIWGALSDERAGLSFAIASGPSHHSQSRVQVPWDSRPYFTLSDLRLLISSPLTTRRVTVEVFDPASTRVTQINLLTVTVVYSLRTDHTGNAAYIVELPGNRQFIKSLSSR
jgi:hypothetical protein